MPVRPFTEKALLFVGILSAETFLSLELIGQLKDLFGAILLETAPSLWQTSRYYEQEMGTPLFRSFLFFRDSYDPARLAETKHFTIGIESRNAENGKRRVNIDPGYMTPSKIVLASTKNYAHRILLGKGIYAEVTLVFRRGRFEPFWYTYRDYCDDEQIALFSRVRQSILNSDCGS